MHIVADNSKETQYFYIKNERQYFYTHVYVSLSMCLHTHWFEGLGFFSQHILGKTVWRDGARLKCDGSCLQKDVVSIRFDVAHAPDALSAAAYSVHWLSRSFHCM